MNSIIRKLVFITFVSVMGAMPAHSQLPDASALTGILGGGALPGGDLMALAPSGAGLPGPGALPSAPGFDGLPGMDSLPGLPSAGAMPGLPGFGGAGALDAIPVFGPVLNFVLFGDFLPRILPTSDPVEKFPKGAALVTDLGLGAAQGPESVLSTVNELGVNAGSAAVPVLGVLLEDPAAVPDYFMNGGTIFFQAVNGSDGNSIFPGAPLISQPVSM